ncbi:MAG TPA: tRNA uridine-5-carboxymethylaminomethyl(34) synthesis GTPase MnmE [Sphaerochaeta sp.]|nr:tRNA uridine-5-carboxymethylaminomethyl(34) synthesis GTPase MnmE [Sphaerochaeta sp.]HQB54677.1 tRNA uridine-5-carboxymethylaminomethyl(34) synthesis GTPase MnmE [Sphaerochaeta sp.]
MSRYRTDDIIYALATPWGSAALAIIRISGSGSHALLAPYFSNTEALRSAKNATLLHGYLHDREGKRIDEVVLAVNTKGHGYTLEEAIEITCHGSLSVVTELLDLLSSIGMRSAEPGEFTFRAFLAGRMDLTQAEAVHELVGAQSPVTRAQALARLEGGLKYKLDGMKDTLLALLAPVEVQLDYSEDEIDEFVFPDELLDSLLDDLGRLLQSYEIGALYKSGARIVLAGATNVGKSSLFNLLLKEERSIVSPIRGTTRDYIEADLLLEGIPIRLYDTAGLREGGDEIEKEGIRRSEHLIGEADLVIRLLDSTEDADPVFDERTIVVYNKADLRRPPEGALAISAATGEGIGDLLAEIARRLKRGVRGVDESRIVIQSKRQADALRSAEAALKGVKEDLHASLPLDIVAIGLNEALYHLGLLTGEATPNDILESIFSNFCVGK